MQGFSTLLRFNRGIVSKLALARIDMKQVALAAAMMTNWMCRVLGSMMLRPGTRYIYEATTGTNPVRYIPFVFSNTDTAILEMSYQQMRVLVSEQVITRVSVGTTIANANPFVTGLTSWTGNDDSGCTSSFSSPYLSLVGTGFGHAKRYQQVTVAAGDQNKEHGLHLIIHRGYVDLLIGTSAGDGSYVNVTQLPEGEYSFAFTPTGNFYVQLQASTQYASLVTSVAIESAGGVTFTTPYQSTDLQNMRWDQSADVIFLVCNGYQQYKINRYATRSWAFVKYYADDGPFNLENSNTALTLTPSAISGDITLTASQAYFNSSMVGQLFRIASQGQTVSATLTGTGQWSNAIEVTGTGTQRQVNFTITGTFSMTVVIQQSIGAPGAWVDYLSYTTTENTSFNDGDNNSTIYYRIGCESTYVSGTATATMTYAGGSIQGVARITAYSSSTSVSAAVVQAFGGTAASSQWWAGEWSTNNGFPTAVQLYQGRLWFAGHDSINGSVSDAYQSFDDTVTGDSGPLSLTIGSGPVDTINWLMGGLLLLVGGQAGEHSLSAGYLGTPITPTAFVIRNPSNFGSSNVQMQKIDWNAVFVKKDGVRICYSSIENAYFAFDYKTVDLTLACPEIGLPGVVQIAIQRIPDTRIHAVRSDGKVVVNVWDSAEEVKAWALVDLGSNAWVEDAFVMPPLPISTIDPNGIYNDANGNTTLVPEDTVYYLVRRVINGTTVRYLERWAWEYECQGGTLSKQIDCHTVIYNGSPSTSISASQLAGQTVAVWGDGIYQGTVTLDGSGNGTLSTACTNVVLGLTYTAQFQSTKLARDLQGVTGLAQIKRIDHLGLIMENVHMNGIQFGTDFNYLDSLPAVEDGATVAANTVWSSYDKVSIEINDIFNTDSRLCLQAQAPYPVTVLAAVVLDSTNVKT